MCEADRRPGARPECGPPKPELSCEHCAHLSRLLRDAHRALQRHGRGRRELRDQLDKALLDLRVLRRQKGDLDYRVKHDGVPKPMNEADRAPFVALARLVAAYSGLGTKGTIPPNLAVLAGSCGVRVIGKTGEALSVHHVLRHIARDLLEGYE